MDAEQTKRAEKWLAEKWRTPECAVCQANAWKVADVVQMEPYAKRPPFGGVYPMLQVICGNCGHTLLFNAILAGIVVENEPSEPASE